MSRKPKIHCPQCGRFMSRDKKHACTKMYGRKLQVGFFRKFLSRSDDDHVRPVSSAKVDAGNAVGDVDDYSLMHKAFRDKTSDVLEGQEVLFVVGEEGEVPVVPKVEEFVNSAEVDSGSGESLGERVLAGEMPMFLTPNEILEGWAPTQNDRLYWYENGRGSPDHEETDEEFWARKLREVKGLEPRRNAFPPFKDYRKEPLPSAPSREAPGFASEEPAVFPTEEYDSLYEALTVEGVNFPISLANIHVLEETVDGPIIKEPQVLGGNHRIAAMKELNPDEPIPVLFFDSLRQAKDSLKEEY